MTKMAESLQSKYEVSIFSFSLVSRLLSDDEPIMFKVNCPVDNFVVKMLAMPVCDFIGLS